MCKITYTRLICLSIALLFITCSHHEFPETPYPRIHTLKVTEVTTEGATFEAEITPSGNEAITDHGFIWGTDDGILDLTHGSSKIMLGSFDGGLFKSTINTGFSIGRIYFMRAFVSTATYTIYGEIVSFKSLGSAAPVITELVPAIGIWGETIEIRGRNFSQKIEENSVVFGSVQATVLSSTESSIKCIVPSAMSNTTVPVYVTVLKKKTESVDFIFQAPIIESFSPQTATFGDIITINGKYFSIGTLYANSVQFNDVIAEVVSVSASQVKVKVPTTITTKESKVSLSTRYQSSSSTNMFTLLTPIINTFTPNKGLTGSYVQITGENFSPIIANNIVTLGGQKVTINDVTKTSIGITIPRVIYDQRSSEIQVTVAGQAASSSTKYELLDVWIRKNAPPLTGPAIGFSINGVGYAGLGQNSRKIWRFSSNNNAWTETATFPDATSAGMSCFVIDGKAYMGPGTPAKKDFWRYDPTTNSWATAAPLPLLTYRAVALSTNGKGYWIARTSSSNFWTYDPIADQWAALPDVPAAADAGFVIDDRLYIYSATAIYPNSQKLFEYDFNSNTWISRSTPPAYGTGAAAFSLNGHGYVNIDSKLCKYDPLSDTWSVFNLGGLSPRSYSTAFTVDNKAYFGLSQGMTGDIWEYDPAYE